MPLLQIVLVVYLLRLLTAVPEATRRRRRAPEPDVRRHRAGPQIRRPTHHGARCGRIGPWSSTVGTCWLPLDHHWSKRVHFAIPISHSSPWRMESRSLEFA